VPLDGAVAGLKAKLAFPSSDFALLHDALFSMSWHASLWPSWQVLVPIAASWHSWCAESLRPDGSGGFLSRGDHRRQRPSIRASSSARHPMLSASFDDCWKAQRRRPHLYDGLRGRPGNSTGRLHQHQGRSLIFQQAALARPKGVQPVVSNHRRSAAFSFSRRLSPPKPFEPTS